LGYVRAYEPEDADELAPHLREADRREMQAAFGVTLQQSIRLVPDNEILCTICTDDDKVVGLFGAVPTCDLSAAVWLVGSDALTQPPLRRQFLVEGKTFLDALHRYRPLLWNYVDERNHLHIRWLKWMGFTFINRHPEYGVEKRPFLEFVRLK
jgi:hypothetical protein